MLLHLVVAPNCDCVAVFDDPGDAQKHIDGLGENGLVIKDQEVQGYQTGAAVFEVHAEGEQPILFTNFGAATNHIKGRKGTPVKVTVNVHQA